MEQLPPENLSKKFGEKGKFLISSQKEELANLNVNKLNLSNLGQISRGGNNEEQNNKTYDGIENADSHKSLTGVNTKQLKKRGNFIFRQELNDYTPNWNENCGITFDLILLFAFLAIGIPSYIYSVNQKEFLMEYTKCGETEKKQNTCTIEFNIDFEIKKGALLYYQLDNFFINHRKLVKSKSWSQLRGNTIKSKIANCDESWTMKEMFGEDSPYYTNKWGHQFSPEDPASPCGLFPRSFFNDTYQLYKLEGGSERRITINETLISNKYLRKTFFKRTENYQETQWIDVEDEHFINWINTETFNDFRKLWGRIEEPITRGRYKIVIKDNFLASLYNAKKYFAIVSGNPLGENKILSIILIGCSSYLFIVILVLWVVKFSKRDKMFDISRLSVDKKG